MFLSVRNVLLRYGRVVVAPPPPFVVVGSFFGGLGGLGFWFDRPPPFPPPSRCLRQTLNQCVCFFFFCVCVAAL